MSEPVIQKKKHKPSLWQKGYKPCLKGCGKLVMNRDMICQPCKKIPARNGIQVKGATG